MIPEKSTVAGEKFKVLARTFAAWEGVDEITRKKPVRQAHSDDDTKWKKEDLRTWERKDGRGKFGEVPDTTLRKREQYKGEKAK